MRVIRSFVAIELPREATDYLAATQVRLQDMDRGRAARWVHPESIHLTLKFLGEVPETRMASIYDAVHRGCLEHTPFSVTLVGLGCFPNTRRPRVVWAGVREASGALERLQEDLDRHLVSLGFPPETRAFRPHLTLARVRQNATFAEAEALGQAVVALHSEQTVDIWVQSVHVMHSELDPTGAVYTSLQQVRLGAGLG